jgi:hypothetical protein
MKKILSYAFALLTVSLISGSVQTLLADEFLSMDSQTQEVSEESGSIFDAALREDTNWMERDVSYQDVEAVSYPDYSVDIHGRWLVGV